MNHSEQTLYLRRLRFPAALERDFQQKYYEEVRSTLRIGGAPLAALVLLFAARDYRHSSFLHGVWGDSSFLLLLCLVLVTLTFHRGFQKLWQPVTVGILWITVTFVFHTLTASGAPRALASDPTLRLLLHTLSFAGQMVIFLVCLSAFRLPFLWATLLNFSLVCSALWMFQTRLHPSPLMVVEFIQRSLIVMFALMMSTLVQERLARRTFLANYLLDQERHDERRQRERTQEMLQVLSQAIGGIVHDLGNPLATVQTSAQMLEILLEDSNSPKETLLECTSILTEGAQILNYLRLSLLEEARALQGKPVPLQRAPTSVRHIVEQGVRYQKARFTIRRRVVISGEDLEVCVDSLKMTTALMNLIGNALKYSDGEVCITWRTEKIREKDHLLLAVCDQGMANKGIAEAQARQLFVAFGRLDAHAEREGTGLGLLSVRKIVEAHGGEIFIEGYTDGTLVSAPFTTARGSYPSLLTENFSSAFVIACPVSLQVS